MVRDGKLTGMPTTLRSAIVIASCCAWRRRSSKVRQYERVCQWSVPLVQSPTNDSNTLALPSSSYYQYHYYYSRETSHTRHDVNLLSHLPKQTCQASSPSVTISFSLLLLPFYFSHSFFHILLLNFPFTLFLSLPTLMKLTIWDKKMFLYINKYICLGQQNVSLYREHYLGQQSICVYL